MPTGYYIIWVRYLADISRHDEGSIRKAFILRFFFFHFASPEFNFRHRLAYSITVNRHVFAGGVTVRGLAGLAGFHPHNTAPGVVADLVAGGFVSPVVRRKPLQPLPPPQGAVKVREGAGEWWNRLAYFPVTLVPDLNPYQSCLLGLLTNFAGRNRRRTYQSSLATILGCQVATVGENLTRLQNGGFLTWSQDVRSELTFNVLKRAADKTEPAPCKPLSAPPEPPSAEIDLPECSRFYLENLRSGGMPENWLLKVYGPLLADQTLSDEACYQLAEEAKREHAANKGTGGWWRLFNYKAEKYGRATNRFHINGKGKKPAAPPTAPDLSDFFPPPTSDDFFGQFRA